MRRSAGSVPFSRRSKALFRFNLQQILNLRRQQEEAIELELAQARRVAQQEEDRLAFFENRRALYQKELLDREKEGVSPADAAIYSAYVAFIKEKIQWQMEAVETARRQVEIKKEEALAARRHRKTLDRLRDKRHQAFEATSRRQERKQIDDVALGRFEEKRREKRG
jgi:flagellar FliJ protein